MVRVSLRAEGQGTGNGAPEGGYWRCLSIAALPSGPFKPYVVGTSMSCLVVVQVESTAWETGGG